MRINLTKKDLVNLVYMQLGFSKQISENIIILNHFEQKDIDLEKKIVVIENADPGYDWIFTKNPSGLITKYGGVASHMSIRCAEIGLPAAIGCGEILYEQLMNSSKVLLDAKNKKNIFKIVLHCLILGLK